MAKEKKGKKKVVVSTSGGTKAKSVVAEKIKTQRSTSKKSDAELTFGRETFKWMGIGIALMALGYVMMLGGNNEDPNVWDPDVIYSHRIITLAPLLILAGLGVQIFAIFKK